MGGYFPLSLSLLLTFLSLNVKPLNSIEFNRALTGVTFTPYAKLPENGTVFAPWSSYTVEESRTMLEVILTRFSNVATYGVGSKNVPYVWNSTYYNDSLVEAYTAEIAAKINLQRNNKSISMLLGMWQHDAPQIDTEVWMALESAEKGNSIYPGTVQGLVFSHHEIASKADRAKQTLQYLNLLRNQSTRLLSLKLGSRQKCYDIFIDYKGDKKKEGYHVDLLTSILKTSDFIICEIEPASNHIEAGALEAFSSITDNLLEFRSKLLSINPKLEVMAQLSWPSAGSNKWENLENLQIYWESANTWASQNNFTVWFFEAFDNPWKTYDAKSAHFGWWRLADNEKSHLVEGYIEKVLEVEPASSSTLTLIISVAVVGFLLFLTLNLVVGILVVRVKNLQQQLTKEEVRQFMEGMSQEIAAQQGEHVLAENALTFPYDKSLELCKDKIKIYRENALGMGQFGCVYRAAIDLYDNMEVALKVARDGCPKSALKGLLSEIKILMYLGKHPNIVALRGAYTAELIKGVVYVATELCALGSLEGFLRKRQQAIDTSRYANTFVNEENNSQQDNYCNTTQQVTFSEMVQWSHEIACGMEYLGTKHVVHADLATRNVLLDATRTAKITDFGLSRRMYNYTNYVKQEQEPLPWRWMAIESLKRCEFSAESDAWSFGVTLWEIFSMGDTPYPGLSWTVDFVNRLVDGLRLESPEYASPEIFKIMTDCWSTEPRDRPTFTKLKQLTGDMISTVKPANVETGRYVNTSL